LEITTEYKYYKRGLNRDRSIYDGDLDSLMKLYEADACFASPPGMLAKGPEGIGECLRSFIDINGKLDLALKRYLRQTIFLVTTEWSFNGTGPDGKQVSMNRTDDLLSIILGEQTNPLGGIKNIILSTNK
jgi:ketosteroid isomerase-like protein